MLARRIPCLTALPALAVGLWCLAAAQTMAATVATDRTTYAPGQDIVVDFTGGPGNPKDWIGIYPAGVTPGDENSTLWQYVDGTSSGSTGLANGSVTFPAGLNTMGNWVVYLLENDGYTVLASAPFSVAGPQVSVDETRYAIGQAIVVSFSGGPGNAKDWIGIYPAGVTPGDEDSTLWQYVDGTSSGSTGLAAGSVTFDEGLDAAGDWVAYLLENDGYTVLAQAAFIVAEPDTLPVVYSLHSAYTPQEPIQIGWQNGPGNPLDWIGIYPEGVVPGSVASTLWLYVDGTQDSSVGLREGMVTFGGGLGLAGDYDVHLLENDGYTILASSQFSIVGPFDPLVRSDKRFYAPGEPIRITFNNSIGWIKDWVGIYPANVAPGDQPATLWLYVDGTQTGNTAVWDGTLNFPQGLDTPGDYIAYLLENDDYLIQARERFTVLPTSGTGPRLLLANPAPGAVNADPRIRFSASITNGLTRLDPATVELRLDGQPVSAQIVPGDNAFEITYAGSGLLAPDSTHTWVLSYRDDATPAGAYSHTIRFTVFPYRNIVLPDPIYFEDFNTTPEGSLPPGWTELNFTDITNPVEDLGNLDSASFARWIVIDADRFDGDFVTYSNPGSEAPVYRRVLSSNPRNVVNGEVLDGPLATGRFLFGNSGYRNVSADGLGQVLYVFTPDFDLSAHADVHLSFHSLWEQNQDSIGAVEYSIDRGQTWLPIVYLLHGPDVLTMTDPDSGEPVIDAVATMTTVRGDIARYIDPMGAEQGGFYGAFIGAPITQELAPYISARVDDNPVESKRVELFRLPAADGQGTVRFRFAHAGTDSWYFGIDNFGLYSIPQAIEPPTLAIQRDADSIVLSWPADSGPVILEQSPTLANPVWTATPGVTGNSVTLPASGPAMFYRLRR